MDESAGLTEAFSDSLRAPPVYITTRMFLQEFTSLSELINDNNYMFFAPRERLTDIKLLMCYDRYQAWYKQLPSALKIEDKEKPEPHVLTLQYVARTSSFSSMLIFSQHALLHNHCASFPADAQSRSNSFGCPSPRDLH